MDDPAEREEFIKHIRQFNETLVLGQDAFLPDAQGIVWDVRDVNNIVPLDYGSAINTHFDVAYLSELLGGCRDRDMVSQVCKTGANFGAEVAMQIVHPHGLQDLQQSMAFNQPHPHLRHRQALPFPDIDGQKCPNMLTIQAAPKS